MFSKYFLLNEIVKFLTKKDFRVLLTSGCFDVAARRDFILLIKALINVDSLLREQAMNLKVISHFISAFPLVVAEASSSGKLKDEIIYSRFQLPVVNFETFKRIVEENMPEVRAIKGKYVSLINGEYLRKRRRELKLSLEELSKRAGTSKKALYEIENKRVIPTLETVEKLENLLKINLKVRYKMKPAEKTYIQPKNNFQKKISLEFFRLGIDNSPVTSTTFDIVGKEKSSLIAGLSYNTSNLEKTAARLKKLMTIFSSQGMFFVKKSDKKIIEGIPIVLESELPELESSEELNKLIKERSNA
jgi:predicted transcriptional regulator